MVHRQELHQLVVPPKASRHRCHQQLALEPVHLRLVPPVLLDRLLRRTPKTRQLPPHNQQLPRVVAVALAVALAIGASIFQLMEGPNGTGRRPVVPELGPAAEVVDRSPNAFKVLPPGAQCFLGQ